MRDLFRDYEEACDNTLLDRRARRRRDRVRQRGAAGVPDAARATTRTRTSASSCIEGAQGALRRSRPAPTCSSASSTSSASSRRWGSPRTSSSCGTSSGTRASRGIRVGPGRGSAAGSCVAYCLRIVDIDPISYDLLFERFLNPGRKQMPDIDMDFDSRYRGEMIRYAARALRRGPRRADRHVLHDQGAGRGARRRARARLPVRRRRQDRQAHAAAHHGPRHAAARVPRAGHRSTRTATRWPPSCATLYEADPDAKRVIDVARGLEGLRRQDGIHAAAVVITREPLTEYLPIQRKPEPAATHRGRADRHAVRDARRRGPRPAQDGLPRPAQPRRHRDHARPRRARPRASRPDIDRVPLDDAKTFELLRARRHRRRVPARRRADARAAALARTRRVRGRRRARRAVPPGPDGPELAQRVRRPQERPQAGHLPAPRPRGGPRAHLRADDLPGAADARRAAARRLLARGGRQPPQGHRQEDPRAHRQGAHEVRRRLRRAGPRRASSASGSSTPSSRSPTTRSTSRTRSATATSRTRPRT